MPEPNIIVAEVTKSWDSASPAHVSQNFELVISENSKRGYRLRDWHYDVTSYPDFDGRPVITETIIAVFIRRGSLADAESEDHHA